MNPADSSPADAAAPMAQRRASASPPRARFGRPDFIFLAAVVLLAFSVRLAWVLGVVPEVDLEDDAGYYHFFGQSIADGRGYTRPEGTPTAFWPVGYPATLALLYTLAGSSLDAAKALNIALGAATAGLVFVLARLWFSSGIAGLGALIYALWPGAIGFTSVTMSETLFTFLFVASLVYLAWAPALPRPAGVLGLGFGLLAALASYVRSQGPLMAIVALPWLLERGWSARRSLVFTAVAFGVVALLLLPWVARNSIRFGEATLIATNTGTAFYLGHREGANGAPDVHAQFAFAQRYDYLPPVKREPAWNREGFREGLRFILAHPLEEPRLSVQKVYHLYRSDAASIPWNEQNGATPIFTATARDRLTLLMEGYYYVFGGLALLGLSLGLVRRAEWAFFCALVIGYWTLLHIVFYGEPRLHVPLLPVFALLAAAAVASILGPDRFGSRLSRPLNEPV